MRDSVVSKKHDDVPDSISGNDEACACYGMVKAYFNEENLRVNENAVACMAESSQQALREGDVVDFWRNENAVTRVKGRVDDYFYDDLKQKQGIALQTKQMGEIIEKPMQIAKSRRKF